MTTIRCDIVSAEAQIFSGNVTMVVASGEEGELGIAPKHIPLVTRLKPGQVRLHHEDGTEQFFFVSGGILEVQPELVTIMADTALRAADIDETKARQAQQEAEKALSGASQTEDIVDAQRKLAEARAQLDALARLNKSLKH